MKKIIVVLMLLMCMISTNTVSASKGITNTGHSDVIELGFIEENSDYRLLNQMSESFIKSNYKKVKNKVFGWSTYTISDGIPIWYISEVVFSKSNKTSKDVVYGYNLKYSKTESKQISSAGSVAGKIGGKVKGISLNLDATFDREVTNKVESYFEEKSDFDLYVPKNTKVSLYVRGEGELYNGVGKNYVLGICMKKGTWEYINKYTEYYELYEEDI